MNEICELCGKLVYKTKGTSYTDCFCATCLRLVAFECIEAAEELEMEEEENRYGYEKN